MKRQYLSPKVYLRVVRVKKRKSKHPSPNCKDCEVKKPLFGQSLTRISSNTIYKLLEVEESRK